MACVACGATFGGTRVKRLLLLTYHVPPRPSIGSVRAGQLMRTLRAHGWEVVPVTPDLGDVHYADDVVTTGVLDFKEPVRRVLGVKRGETTHEALGAQRGMIESAPSLKQRAIRFGFDVTEYANRSFGWLGHGTNAVKELLARERFDAVLSTSPPETTHAVASRVHGTLPWIADLRDPWRRDGWSPKPQVLAAFDRMLEPRTLRSASAITTVSEPIAEALRARYPHIPVYAIPNAFDERDFADVPFADPPAATFVHAGQLYAGRRDPRPFLDALADVLRDGLVRHDEVRVEFYGDDSEWLREAIRRRGLGGNVRVHGKRARAEILQIERAASRLMLFLWDDPSERGTYTGKLFEYLGARRRILAVGGPEEMVIDEVLERTGAGERYRTVAGIRDAIVQAVHEWRAGTHPTVSAEAIAPYGSDRLGDAFAAVLDREVSCSSVSSH